LPNGQWIWLEKTGWEKTKMMLGKGKKREKMRYGLIFTLEKDHLEFVREHGPYNMAADESVF